MSRITDELLKNMVRHAELKREDAIEKIRDKSDQFLQSLGELELSYWTDIHEVLLELTAFRAATRPGPVKVADTALELLATLQIAEKALAESYDLQSFPGEGGDSEQERALSIVRAVISKVGS